MVVSKKGHSHTVLFPRGVRGKPSGKKGSNRHTNPYQAQVKVCFPLDTSLKGKPKGNQSETAIVQRSQGSQLLAGKPQGNRAPVLGENMFGEKKVASNMKPKPKSKPNKNEYIYIY